MIKEDNLGVIKLIHMETHKMEVAPVVLPTSQIQT